MILAPGTRIKVRDDWPETRGPCHLRTPHFLRGETGTIVRHLGDFPNPEDLAFARAAALLPLYHVSFASSAIWPEPHEGDEIIAELYGPWLEAA